MSWETWDNVTDNVFGGDPRILYFVVALVSVLLVIIAKKCSSLSNGNGNGNGNGNDGSATTSATIATKQSQYESYDKDVIILHVFPRWDSKWPDIWKDELSQLTKKKKKKEDKEDKEESSLLYFSNASAFCVKLESLLTYFEFDYVLDFTTNMGSKSKSPWITYYHYYDDDDDKEKEGKWVDLADSQIVIETLLKKRNKRKMNDFYCEYNDSSKDRLMAHSLRLMFEESLYFFILYHRWLDNGDEYIATLFGEFGVPSFVMPLLKWYMKRALSSVLDSQGVSRHSRKEVYAMFKQTLDAIMLHLQRKDFLFGDQIKGIDCIAFAMLTGIYEPNIDHYKGFADFYNDHDNPLIAYQDQVFDYCTRVRIQLEKKRIQTQNRKQYKKQ